MTALSRAGNHIIRIDKAAELVLDGKWQLPHFQRPYVWSRDQQRELFKSLMENFPVSSILLWDWDRTKGPPIPFSLGPASVELDKATHLVIDGQQRLATIAKQYLLAETEMGHWSQFDGRSTGVVQIDFSNKDYEEDLRLIIPGKAAERGRYAERDGRVLLPGLLRDDFERQVLDHLPSELQRRRAMKVRNALTQRILLYDTLPRTANIDQAIDAFERINSEGTRLGVVDIAAAQIFFADRKLSTATKKLHRELAGKPDSPNRFPVFGIDLLIRSILFHAYEVRGIRTASPAVTQKMGRSRMPNKTKVSRAWKLTKKAFEELKDFLTNDFKLLDSSALGSSKLAILVASQAFVRRRLTEEDRQRLKRWLVLAAVFKPYSGTSTNTNVDRDMDAMSRSGSIDWTTLDRTLQENARGSSQLEILPEHLYPDEQPLGRQHILNHVTWLLAHHQGAIDWVSGSPIPALHPGVATSSWDRHHIFPVSYMRESDSYRPHTNRAGNKAWLSKDTNRNHLRNRPPDDYLKKVRLSDFGERALKAQSVSFDPRNYGDPVAFIAAREKQLAVEINQLLTLWGTGRESKFEVDLPAKRRVQDLIKRGEESHTVEFKSSFHIEPNTGQKQGFLQHAVLKTLVSFANSGGGTLLVGVDDDGRVHGIEGETEVLKRLSSSGRAELPILIRDYVKKETYPKGKNSFSRVDYLAIEVEPHGGKKVLVARVFQTPEPIWMFTKPVGTPDRGVCVVYQRSGASTEVVREAASPPQD